MKGKIRIEWELLQSSESRVFDDFSTHTHMNKEEERREIGEKWKERTPPPKVDEFLPLQCIRNVYNINALLQLFNFFQDMATTSFLSYVYNVVHFMPGQIMVIISFFFPISILLCNVDAIRRSSKTVIKTELRHGISPPTRFLYTLIHTQQLRLY
jgi:hypothetical protein